MHECTGPGGLLQAAVDVARPSRFDCHYACGAGGLHCHDATCGYIQPVHDVSVGQQRNRDAPSSG